MFTPSRQLFSLRGKLACSANKSHGLISHYSQNARVFHSAKDSRWGTSKWFLLAAAGTVGGGVAATYYFGPKSDNKQFRHTAALLHASYRILNMVKVSTILAIDYGWVVFQQKGVKSPVEAAADELKLSNDAFVEMLRRKQRGELISEEDLQRGRDRIELGGKVIY